MNFILFDDHTSEHLLPFTLTRTSAQIRFGITTIAQKWTFYLDNSISFLPYRTYLNTKYSPRFEQDNLYINARFCPSNPLVDAILKTKENQMLLWNNQIIALRTDQHFNHFSQINPNTFDQANLENQTTETPLFIQYPYHIFAKNQQAIEIDFEDLTRNRTSATISNTNRLIGNEKRFFAEQNATAECATFNTKNGYIYLAKDSEVMENASIRGGFALGQGSTVKMGAKIYANTTIGNHCKVGGEISNSVIFANSNKGHEGFLGNAVIGEWCNIGADTNNSNLKNTYDDVKLWDYPTQKMKSTGLQFCGLMLADHAKCGINTMFNTGTVVGVGANVFGGGFPPNFIPSFAWGGSNGLVEYQWEKFLETAKKVFQRRNLMLSQTDIDILTHIFNDPKR